MNNLSLYHLFRLLVKNILVIILVALVFGVSAFSYCQYFVEEKYSATGSVIVTNGAILEGKNNSNTVQSSDITASIHLLSTVKDILSTNDIYKRLAEELGGQYTYMQLKGYATVNTRSDNSLFIDVKFETTTKSEAVQITNAFLELAPDYINKFIPNSATGYTLADTAVKTSPKTTSTTIIAMLVGAILCYAVVYFISLGNVTIENEDDFKDYYDIPVLGNIPDFSEAQTKKYAKYYYRRG